LTTRGIGPLHPIAMLRHQEAAFEVVNSATSALKYCEVLIVHDLLAGGIHRLLSNNNRSARNVGFRYFISLSAAFHAKVFRTPLFATFGTARAHATPFDSPQCARLIVAYRASSAENLAWLPKAPYSVAMRLQSPTLPRRRNTAA